MLAVTLLATVILWLLFFNQLHAVSVNPALARTKGVPVRLMDNLFVVIIAVVVMLAIQWVGLLIINAMLILPAAAARNVAGNLRSYHLLALIFGLFSGVLGLLLSYFNAVAAGPTIVLIAAVLFFGTFFIRSKGEGRARIPRPARISLFYKARLWGYKPYKTQRRTPQT